ncbi:GntR family transcriptional regulator [Roseibium marinum]|uniref:DNA-binding GntR family transcriptional regulator n=1 Tax=Roseibium marinum TaxID=281252 RepID=A0A2S3UNY8_9HYPH|nr:FCD domain-containing protein [Roseibium marinum]POF29438.1 DNA-binding GntR family transcriptional regulator [Roseibium marinum]
MKTDRYIENGDQDASDGATLADTAYGRLRRDIITSVRAPGERLRIEKLKSIYQIGPTPLREAMQKLAQDGLVVSEGNRGFTVAPLDPAEFKDLNLARTVIEKEALRLSIEQGGDAWEAGIVAAAYIMAKEDTALMEAQGHVPDSWERANSGLHLALVSACGSAWLLKLRGGLHDLCERYRRASVYRKIGARDLTAEHAAIVDATLARNADLACRLIEEHFALTASALAASRETGSQSDRGD